LPQFIVSTVVNFLNGIVIRLTACAVIVAFSYCILILLALLLCSFLHYILYFIFPTVYGEKVMYKEAKSAQVTIMKHLSITNFTFQFSLKTRAVVRLISLITVNCAINFFNCALMAVLSHIFCYIFQFVCAPFAGRCRRPTAVER